MRAMGGERKYSEITWCFIPQAYYLQHFKAKAKMILHTEAKPRYILWNNFNNKLNQRILWSKGTALRKDQNTGLLPATHPQ